MKRPKTKADLRRNELLLDVAEVTAAQLIKVLGVSEDKALDVGNSIADFISDHRKGQNIYVPVNWCYSCIERDWSIHKRLTRGNAHELAAEFGISFVRIYQISKRCQLKLKQQREQEKINEASKR